MGSRPIMLVHGTADEQGLPQRTQDLYHQAKAMGLNVTLHWCAGARHGKLNDACPDDLAAWLEGFLDRSPRRVGAG
jgi:alpha-beta hydrolase superfamily lysophospholipase